MSYKDQLQKVNQEIGLFFQESPEVGKAFRGLTSAAHEGEHLDAKSREIIAIGISVALRCEACILSHVNTAIMHGVTFDEIVEVVEVAVSMGGGPSVAYGSMAVAVAKEFIG